MRYDWKDQLPFAQGSKEWFEEIDRRFLSSAYYAKGENGKAFGRYLPAELRGARVLEIGCGMGTHASMLAGAGARYTTVDLTAPAVKMTSQRFKIFDLRGAIIQADAEKLPFASNSFDMVWSWGVIHHSTSTEQCLSEISRVLRDGGKLFLMVYHRSSLVYYLHCGLIRGIFMGQLLSRSLQDIYTSSSDGFYARVFTRRELLGILKENYEDISIDVVGLKAELFPIPASSLKRSLENSVPDRFAEMILKRWGSMIVVSATKSTRHPIV